MKPSFIFVLLFLTAACTQKQAPADSPPKPEDLVEAGRKIYSQHCTACHNVNPAEVGAVGPAIKGSPLELLQARVLTSKYPPGYKPQRETNSMPVFSYLAKDIPALHAYLSK